MLSKLIQNVRTKPESVRRGITLGVSLGITGIIGFFWFISFLNYSTEVLTAKPKVESPASFLTKMSTLIGESYANVRAKIKKDSVFVRDSTTGSSTTPGEVTAEFGGVLNETEKTADVLASSTKQSLNNNDLSDMAKRTSTISVSLTTASSSNASSSQNSKSLGEILNRKK